MNSAHFSIKQRSQQKDISFLIQFTTVLKNTVETSGFSLTRISLQSLSIKILVTILSWKSRPNTTYFFTLSVSKNGMYETNHEHLSLLLVRKMHNMIGCYKQHPIIETYQNIEQYNHI